jgi:hypothetical protein|tara:strand:+ start:132 stop:491 length:360 start_codon:yes stop_codon:yes gene_type:complete
MDRREEIFQQLKEILVPYSTDMVVVIDKPDNYYLNTHHVMKNKKPMYFGSVKISKNYISFHLMPVYVFPDLLETITPELKKRMQGKSCFNFKTEDTKLFQQLKALTQAGYEKYEDTGYL